jgi:hypothetical protein
MNSEMGDSIERVHERVYIMKREEGGLRGEMCTQLAEYVILPEKTCRTLAATVRHCGSLGAVYNLVREKENIEDGSKGRNREYMS